jgi:glycosyltransferase involved in cell wall biosynthesis
MECLKLDVIIVTYNRLSFLKKLLYSIELQTILPNKVIIYDDCSDDDTIKYLHAFDGNLDIELLQGVEKSPNVAVSRNKCLDLVNSKYVIIMDDDDLMPINKIEKSIEALSEANAQMVTGDTIIFDVNKKIEIYSKLANNTLKTLESSFFYERNPLQWATIAFETSALKDVGGFDERFTMITDWSVYLRISCKYKCIYIPNILGYYRIHTSNMSTNILALINDLNIFVKDRGASQYGIEDYITMSSYIFHIENGEIYKAVLTVINSNSGAMSFKRKTKLVIIAVSRVFNILRSFKEGKKNTLGSADSRIINLI